MKAIAFTLRMPFMPAMQTSTMPTSTMVTSTMVTSTMQPVSWARRGARVRPAQTRRTVVFERVRPALRTAETRRMVRPVRKMVTTMMNEHGVTAQDKIAKNNVMVFSTTYCPYCARVKALFQQLGIEFAAWEVDVRADGDDVRSWLLETTGQRTVPNVFINGQQVGGCDDVFDLHAAGKLLDMVAARK